MVLFFNFFRDLDTNAKKDSYERAAKEYEKIYQDLEQQYRITVNVVENNTLSQSKSIDLLIDNLYELERSRDTLIEKFKNKSHKT